MASKKIRSYSDVYTAKDAKKFATKNLLPSMTKQAEADACDINNIMKQYENTGRLPDMIRENPQYGDFSAAVDFQTAMGIVAKAQDQFHAMDAHIRDRFNNDPARFLEFAENKENLPEMVKMGLATQRHVVDMVPETPKKAKAASKVSDDTSDGA